MKETSTGTFPFLNKGSPLSLFLSYLAWLIPLWVTGTALSRGYETFQHQTGGVKTLQMFSVCSRHFEPKTRLFISLKVCIYLCCRSQTSRPKWTPSRAPNLCRLLLLPVCDRKRTTSAVTLHLAVKEANPIWPSVQNPALPTTLPACLPSR